MALREQRRRSRSARMTTRRRTARIVASFRTAPARAADGARQRADDDPAGAAALLDAVADGKAPPRCSCSPSSSTTASPPRRSPDLEKRVKQLTRGVAAPKDELDKLIAAAPRRLRRPPSPIRRAGGERSSRRTAPQCHQVDGKGGVVGPQLAGVSKRGVDRLIEDILDPNRNVDPAFRYSNVILKDTTLITGLQKREEGETLVFVDTTGQGSHGPEGGDQERIESRLSLMPANFAEIIPPEEFNNLMAFLMASKPPRTSEVETVSSRGTPRDLGVRSASLLSRSLGRKTPLGMTSFACPLNERQGRDATTQGFGALDQRIGPAARDADRARSARRSTPASRPRG